MGRLDSDVVPGCYYFWFISLPLGLVFLILYFYFRKPFFSYVLKGRRGTYREADEKDVGLWIGKRSKSVVILLTSSIEQPQRVRLRALLSSKGGLGYDHDSDSVIIEHGGHVLVRELVRGV